MPAGRAFRSHVSAPWREMRGEGRGGEGGKGGEKLALKQMHCTVATGPAQGYLFGAQLDG